MLLYSIALLGFAAYEVSVRIVESKNGFIEEIGILKYLTYLLIFGLFSVVFAGSFANMIPTGSLSIFLAVLGGYVVPAGGRLALATLIESYFSLVQKLLIRRKRSSSKVNSAGESRSVTDGNEENATTFTNSVEAAGSEYNGSSGEAQRETDTAYLEEMIGIVKPKSEQQSIRDQARMILGYKSRA